MTRANPEIDFSNVPLGSISSGTLQPRDLVPAFLGTLESIGGEAEEAAGRIRKRYADVFDAESIDDADPDAVGFLLETLEDALSECAPGGHRFGAHEGDGADFGFWPFDEED